MKPCSSCPFQPTAPPGLWHPAHYLEIAYLESVEEFTEPDDLATIMLCHKTSLTPSSSRAGPPLVCWGWVHAAPDSFRVRVAYLRGRIRADEPEPLPVLSPEQMMAQNGFDLSQLPPLRWSPEDTRYPDHSTWVDAVVALRAQLREDPEYAWRFVLPNSPLDRGITPETVEATLGKPGLRRYAQQLRRGL